MNNNPIGVYDSGIGGLTVLKTLQRRFPHENFIYFADTANLPYGTKTKDQIISFAHRIISWMDTHKHVKAVVAACHTSSALALDEVSALYPFPLIGTIYPLVKALSSQSFCKKIGILATPASAKSQVHEKILKQSGFAGDVITISCPEFVPFIEANDLLSPILKAHAQSYVRPVLDQNLDTLIYGCTHYPFLSPLIRSLIPPSTITVDPADAVADCLFDCLSAQDLLLPPVTSGKTDFYCSWAPLLFQQKLSSIFSLKAPVSLEPLDDFLPLKRVANG